MGCGGSKPGCDPQGPSTYDGDADSFVLQHPGTCTGMFWRGAPTPAHTHRVPLSVGAEQPSWPRNGSILRGLTHVVPGDASAKWLEVVEYCQAGRDKWEAAPGCWMPFTQDGLLLHPL
jgi:hypothetical protein